MIQTQVVLSQLMMEFFSAPTEAEVECLLSTLVDNSEAPEGDEDDTKFLSTPEREETSRCGDFENVGGKGEDNLLADIFRMKNKKKISSRSQSYIQCQS